MNRTAIKKFATWARGALREQVKMRLKQYGIAPDEIVQPQEVTGGLIVAGQTLDEIEAAQYRELRFHLDELSRVWGQKQAIETLIDEIAYTWFNRLAALRYMEVNRYIGRVLSSSDPGFVDPDILREASAIAQNEELPGLDFATLEEWRSLATRAPNADEFLYRRLLIVQCEALSDGIPFLFDRAQFYMALFMPANLLNQESIVRRLTNDIPEEDWQAIEIVGWLYQFYISERKDEVIGAKGKVAAQDIPAATQLFTPHWIVRYMVENSLGRLWLEGHPESRLREKMPYYLESPNLESPIADEAEVTEPAEGQLEILPPPSQSSLSIPLTPQELTVCDPACGSGHILVYAFDLLFEIYLEQGYRSREIPGLILAHNLVGLDIDDRAVQLASFAVLMKARQYNTRILSNPPELNVVTVRSTRNLRLPEELTVGDWQPLIQAFEDADHLGSLITPPAFDAEKLTAQLDAIEQGGSIFTAEIQILRGVILQAQLLRKQYWVVVANPPYMASGSFNPTLKAFVTKHYPYSKEALFAVFIERCLEQTCECGLTAMINQHSWMFLSSYEDLRKLILKRYSIQNMLHLGYGVFRELNSKVVQSAAFVISKDFKHQEGVYLKLLEFQGSGEENHSKTLEAIANPSCSYVYYTKSTEFEKIPGNPISYWASNNILEIFSQQNYISKIAKAKKGMAIGDNPRFVRNWFEVETDSIFFCATSKEEALQSQCKWFPYNDGGSYRKWYGNYEAVVNWKNDGFEVKQSVLDKNQGHWSRYLISLDYFFKSGLTWTAVSTSSFGARFLGQGFLFSSAGMCLFSSGEKINYLIGFLNSIVGETFLEILNPTLNFGIREVKSIPFIEMEDSKYDYPKIAKEISQQDWNNFEVSWNFQSHPLIRNRNAYNISQAFANWQTKTGQAFQQLKQLEEENNRYWINVYGLQDELTPEVPDDQITIRRADRSRDIRSLISYGVGCILGRYSLDKPGLIHAGQPFDPTQHTIFPADPDGILPITDELYFDNDLTTRFIDFIRTAYTPAHLQENLDFIAHALTLRDGETAQTRLRRYFLTEFISDHIQTYKKRPIYWLFTSGKKRAFNALVYLHRYTPDTLARLRTDYVLELQVKLDRELDRLQSQLTSANATTKKSLNRRIRDLQDQQLELRDYQAKLQTLADARIELDLDDGVAYNYTRFKSIIYEGADLKMADLEKKAQWKLDLLKKAGK